MGRRALGLGLLLAVAAPALADTGARFTLGLGLEYLSTAQTVNDVRLSESTLQPVVSLGFDGSVVDPRFLVFNGLILATGFKLDQTGEEASTRRQLDYGLGMRAFSNRPVSLEVSARRSDASVTGPQAGALQGGVDQTYRATLDVRPQGWPQLRLSHWADRFTADDPATLRDQKMEVTELTGNWSRGILAFDLLLRREKDEFNNSLFSQEVDLGNLSLELNRGGRDSFLGQLFVNRYVSEFGTSGESPVTTSVISRNRYRHLIGERGSADLFYNHQTAEIEGGPALKFDQPGGTLVLPLTRDLQAEAEASYLVSDLDSSRQLRQPFASLGFRFGKDLAHWSFSVNPAANYVSVSGTGVSDESSWGWQLYGAVRTVYTGFSAGLEGQYTGNQLAIGTLDPTTPIGGAGFLTGLDKSRSFVRFSFLAQPSRSVVLSGSAEARRVVRLTPTGDVTEEFGRGQADLVLGPLRLSAAASQLDVIGGALPSTTRIGVANLYFTPTYWLQVDGLIQTENRNAFGVSGKYQFAEAGLRLRYAQLSLYARVRTEESGGSNSKDYKNRRVWAGIGRTFDFKVGRAGR